MDSDDGLFLHIDDSPVKSSKLKNKRPAKSRNRIEPGNRVADERPAKRPRIEQPRNDFHSEHKAPGQIISSLFTYNPVVSSSQKPVAPSAPAKPTNAPLTDASTFAGLGLNQLLVNHLQSKMNINAPTAVQRASLSLLLHHEHESSDAFIQSQTGSGKTLAFLLPIIQDLLPLSSLSYIDRSIGTLAIIIAPTRELAKQIYDVLEILLQLRLRQSESAEAGGESLTRFLVPGLLIGGSTRAHEKARLRKGLPILVCTPGRLLDHLQNTSSFNVGKCRWLVLDEADHLMELGFEESIKGILTNLDGRRKLAIQAVKEGIHALDVGGWDWERQRRTLLCSATMRDDVQKLAGTTLHDPVMIKALENSPVASNPTTAPSSSTEDQFTLPPAQLSQRYIVVPLKLRLVTLIALLRLVLSKAARKNGASGTKIMVFFSCTDSVDFHLKLLGGAKLGSDQQAAEDATTDVEGETKKEVDTEEQTYVSSPLLPDTTIYKLHGSLTTAVRLSSLKSFAQPSTKGNKILFSTSVASRGLDLPLVQCVIQYDLPTEGGLNEYVHRVGRTARVGKVGESWCFVAPSETGWADMVLKAAKGKDKEGKGMKLGQEVAENILKRGFGGGKGKGYEERATEVQLAFERWVLHSENKAIARNAFHSYAKAYATHPSSEKRIFHVKNLHFGHLAKSFGLRETPSSVGTSVSTKSKPGKKPPSRTNKAAKKATVAFDNDSDTETPWRTGVAEKKMKAMVRAQGRLSKQGGAMVSTGTDEYHIGKSGYEI